MVVRAHHCPVRVDDLGAEQHLLLGLAYSFHCLRRSMAGRIFPVLMLVFSSARLVSKSASFKRATLYPLAEIILQVPRLARRFPARWTCSRSDPRGFAPFGSESRPSVSGAHPDGAGRGLHAPKFFDRSAALERCSAFVFSNQVGGQH